MLLWVIIANRQNKRTRLAHYFQHVPLEDRQQLQDQAINASLDKTLECSFTCLDDYDLVHRHFNSVTLIAAVKDDNLLAISEFLQCFYTTMSQALQLPPGKLGDLDVLYNEEKIHEILQVMVVSNHVINSNPQNIIQQIILQSK